MTDQSSSSPPSRRSGFRKFVFAIIAAAIGLIVLEGIASFVWIGIDLVGLWKNGTRVKELKEESHCQYDKEIGWIHKPNTAIEDHYGRGRNITINQDGVRALEDYAGKKNREQFRIICLGDSFTLGYGVDDRETFPWLLEDTVGDSLQVVNMGQGGYSIGQSYLWLKRMHFALEPDAVVCIFIVEDFRRLAVQRTANGYATPAFADLGGTLQVENIPVPPRLEPGSLLLQSGEVSSVLTKHSSLARSIGRVVPKKTAMDYEHALSTGVVLLREISKLCQGTGCPMVLVLTPTRTELGSLNSVADYQSVSAILKEFTGRENIPYLDLRPAFENSEPPHYRFFLDEAFHHYSPDGNRVVADALANWLPDVIEKFPKTDD